VPRPTEANIGPGRRRGHIKFFRHAGRPKSNPLIPFHDEIGCRMTSASILQLITDMSQKQKHV
jgi:hypothetical protein